MKRTSLVVVALSLALLLAGSLASAATLDIVGDSAATNAKISSGRTIADYAAALQDLVGADSVGRQLIMPERNNYKYLFLPLMKDGKVIGYGTWVNTVIYQHPEDIIAVVNPDGSLQKWAAIDANDHHGEMKDEKIIGKFYGMTKDRGFDPEVDGIAGSTISVNTFFAELKNLLLVFDLYIKPQI